VGLHQPFGPTNRNGKEAAHVGHWYFATSV
jgi:hypothetical protein